MKVKWPSKNAQRKLPKDLESLGKMLLSGTYKQIAHAAWTNHSIKSSLTELMLKDIEKEATKLCSKKNPSILRTTDKQSMLSFSMEKVSDEIKERAPLFHSVLSAASINSRSRATKEISHFGPIAMAAAVCLNSRSKYMTAVQLLVTINVSLPLQLDGRLCAELFYDCYYYIVVVVTLILKIDSAHSCRQF